MSGFDERTGTYEGYASPFDAFSDLFKDPSEFTADYAEFYSPEARMADWLRIGADFRRAIHAIVKTMGASMSNPTTQPTAQPE